MVTLGYRSTESVGETNLILFSTFKHMFGPTIHRIREWGFLRGIKELRWIGYPSWESVVLNFLLLLPLGYLLPPLSGRIHSWCRILLVGFGVQTVIKSCRTYVQHSNHGGSSILPADGSRRLHTGWQACRFRRTRLCSSIWNPRMRFTRAG